MKILLLTYEYPPFKGGVATYLSNLVKTAPADVKIIVDVPPNREHWLITAIRLYFKVRRERPDLIAISHVLPAGYIAFKINFWFKIPYLVFAHGTDVLSAKKHAWKRFWLGFILKRAKFIVANSRFTAGLLKQEGISKIEIVPPGVVVPNGSVNVTAKPNQILSIGRLVPRKGFDTLIKAMPAIIKDIPDAHLTIVGRGAYYDELVRIAHELRVEKFVSLLTDVADTTPYLNEASAFVLAARQEGADIEGFGIVTLEASAAGLPVIVTNSGGAAEPVVDNVTGFVVNTDALAKTIVRLLGDKPLAQKLGAAGREYVRKEYSIEVVANKFWKILTAPQS